MNDRKIYTPVGIRDLLPDETHEKRCLESDLRALFSRYGYREIETPGLEYLNVYRVGNGFADEEELFKLTDANGSLLCLRYDGTVPTARLAATVMRDEPLPLRLCYIGQMFRFSEAGGGRQRVFGQAGIEFIGSAQPEADAEIIHIAIRAARAAGIEDLQVSIGQVAFFKGLVEAWGIDNERAGELQRIINRKESVALEDWCEAYALSEEKSATLHAMVRGNANRELLDRWISELPDCTARDALVNLNKMLNILEDYGDLPYCSIDLGMLQDIEYYSGMIFRGYTYGIGFPVFTGGRYDTVMKEFGRDLPATGVSIGTDMILIALSRQGKRAAPAPRFEIIEYAEEARALAFKRADELRSNGAVTICISEKENAVENRPVSIRIAADGTVEFAESTAQQNGDMHR